MKKLLFSLLIPATTIVASLLLIGGCNSTKHITSPKKAKNVILIIGDGMGLGQITGGMIANGMKTELERFPITGLHKSYASDNLITDSAAGATAFAAGIKTYNGAIAVNPDTQAVYTLLEEAEDKDMPTGLVATSTIVHATPASFIAHNKSRRNYEEIAADFLNTEVDYFVGGGKKFFDRREDERNLIEELKQKGYTMENFLEHDFDKSTVKGDNYGFLTADKDPLPVSQGRTYLTDASVAGIDFLNSKSDDGFFLMIEGSQIDWGGHANDESFIITEFKDFDNMLKPVIDWAINDGNTLIVVTADHETGGFAIQSGSTRDTLKTAFTSDYHTGTMIPVFAMGPGSEKFSGIYENTAIYNKIRNALGWIGQ